MFVVKAWKQQMLAEAKKESETSVKFGELFLLIDWD
jgi:hypothetical protein